MDKSMYNFSKHVVLIMLMHSNYVLLFQLDTWYMYIT